MSPVAAAIQLTRVWRQICPNDDPYPIDCRLLAEALKIKVYGESINDRFEAQLRIRRKRNGQRFKAIIYNENIREQGRKNFCISHEIGHSSCHAEREEFFCSSADLNDMAPHPRNIEQEANKFAASLLMPPDDFRSSLEGRPNTLETIGRLAEDRYSTSLTATCMRLLEISPSAFYGMAIVQGNVVKRWARSESMRWTGFGFRQGHELPVRRIEHNPAGEPVDSEIWLNEKNAVKWNLVQSAVHMPYYGQTLVLIAADRSERRAELEEWEPSLLGTPQFR